MHCDSSTPKLMSKFLLICSIFNMMALPICVCGLVSELSMSSSFLCFLKENQLLIKINQPFSCLSCLSIVSFSWFKYCPSTLSWLFHFQAIISKLALIPINEPPYKSLAIWFLCPTIVFILTGILGVSASYRPTRSLYVKLCVLILKSTP
jgi:hypothetical protein